MLALEILREHGRTFTPDMVPAMLTRLLPYDSVCTAERVAYRNRVLGLHFPQTATFLNPYCAWRGAQIRADAYGYVCPGQPARAARVAWQDAATSHVKNGIYGATAGSIAGVMCGAAALEPRRITPFNDPLHTALCGQPSVKISELIARTCTLAQTLA